MRGSFIPILRPTIEETLALAVKQAEATSYSLLKERRQMCMDFYHNEIQVRDGGNDEYLKNRSGQKDASGQWQYKDHLLLEHINLTEQVIDLKSRIYREQPARSVNGKEAQKYTTLLQTSRWFAFSKRFEQYMNLLHDVAAQVFYDEVKKRLVFQLIPEYVPVFDEDDPMQIDPVAIIFPTAKRTAKEEVVYAYYDKDVHREMTKDGKIELVEDNKVRYFSFLFAHRKVPVINHFSTPAVNLVDANQAIDAALTALNQSLHYNAHKQLAIMGKIAEKDGKGRAIQFGLGNAQIINLDTTQALDNQKLGVQVVDLTVDQSGMVEAVRAKMQFVFESYNITGNYKIEGTAASGYSLDMQNAKDYEDRRQSFDILTDYIEQPLHNIVTAISDRYNLGIEKGELFIDFAEPKTEVSVTDKIAWQNHLLETGQADLADIVVMNNPELTREEAMAYLSKRKPVEKKVEPTTEIV